jgi:hypothetical protein
VSDVRYWHKADFSRLANLNFFSQMEDEMHYDGTNPRLIVATIVAVLAAGAVANAQTVQTKLEERLTAAVKKIEAACGEDLKKYCSTVTPGEGRLLLCLEAHEDKISTQCEYSLFSAARNLDRALDRIEQTADACWNDIEKHCASVPAGGGGITRCLINQKSSLQPACGSKIDELFASGK